MCIRDRVGEIWDEHDDEQEDFKQQSDGSFLISCNANLDKMLELLEINEEYEVSTVNGWVMHCLLYTSTFYLFNPDFLSGTWAQLTIIILALATVFVGSMSVSYTHLDNGGCGCNCCK